MKIKTSELTDLALDWAVATCEGRVPKIEATVSYPNKRHYKVYVDVRYDSNGNECPVPYSPSTDPAKAWPIIEREKIDTAYTSDGWYANMYWRGQDNTPGAGDSYRCGGDGPTPLVAAMRCFVASKLGDEVDIPEELL